MSIKAKVDNRRSRDLAHKELKRVRMRAKLMKASMSEEERLLWRLKRAKRKEALLEQHLRKYELPEDPDPIHDPEMITPEQLQAYKKIGYKNKNYVPVGRRGIYGGVVQNMHMHWKKHETVQVDCDKFKKNEIREMAMELAKLSGGIVVDIHQAKTIIMYRGRNYKQPKGEMVPGNTLTKRKALFKSKHAQALEGVRMNISGIEDELRRLKRRPKKDGGEEEISARRYTMKNIPQDEKTVESRKTSDGESESELASQEAYDRSQISSGDDVDDLHSDDLESDSDDSNQSSELGWMQDTQPDVERSGLLARLDDEKVEGAWCQDNVEGGENDIKLELVENVDHISNASGDANVIGSQIQNRMEKKEDKNSSQQSKSQPIAFSSWNDKVSVRSQQEHQAAEDKSDNFSDLEDVSDLEAEWEDDVQEQAQRTHLASRDKMISQKGGSGRKRQEAENYQAAEEDESDDFSELEDVSHLKDDLLEKAHRKHFASGDKDISQKGAFGRKGQEAKEHQEAEGDESDDFSDLDDPFLEVDGQENVSGDKNISQIGSFGRKSQGSGSDSQGNDLEEFKDEEWDDFSDLELESLGGYTDEDFEETVNNGQRAKKEDRRGKESSQGKREHESSFRGQKDMLEENSDDEVLDDLSEGEDFFEDDELVGSLIEVDEDCNGSKPEAASNQDSGSILQGKRKERIQSEWSEDEFDMHEKKGNKSNRQPVRREGGWGRYQRAANEDLDGREKLSSVGRQQTTKHNTRVGGRKW